MSKCPFTAAVGHVVVDLNCLAFYLWRREFKCNYASCLLLQTELDWSLSGYWTPSLAAKLLMSDTRSSVWLSLISTCFTVWRRRCHVSSTDRPKNNIYLHKCHNLWKQWHQMTRLLSNHGVAGDISQILLHTNNINTLKLCLLSRWQLDVAAGKLSLIFFLLLFLPLFSFCLRFLLAGSLISCTSSLNYT